MLLIGHKGADALVEGNTLASFAAAVEAGVHMIELDVLRPQLDFDDGSDWRKATAGPALGMGPLVVAHDWGDAARRQPLTLAETLDAFTRPPLDAVEIDLDLKIAGREHEVLAALRERGLIERTMLSTMEYESLMEVGRLDPSLRRGWTVPRVTRDWPSKLWAKPIVPAALFGMRRRLPGWATRELARIQVEALWVYHPLITKRLIEATHAAGVELIAWTVDDVKEMRKLAALGVDGICSNDPLLFTELNPVKPLD